LRVDRCQWSRPPQHPTRRRLRCGFDGEYHSHLIGDIEQLREHLGIDRWIVQGGSWGVTLALAYAQEFPDRVSEMLLVSVTLTRAADVHWFAHETGRYFPEAWSRFQAGVPEGERDDLVAAYDRRINHYADPAVRSKAAQDWCAWEDAIISLDDHPYLGSRAQSEAGLVCFARLVTHYFAHAAFLPEGISSAAWTGSLTYPPCSSMAAST